LADLARRTRIRLENLESLEKDDLEALPTDPYVRGFVKQVCRELGLPAHDGLRRYEHLREVAAPSDEIVWAVERTRTETAAREGADPDRAVGVVGRYGLWVAGAGILALLGFVALRAFDRAEPSASSPPAERVAPAPTVADAPAGEPQPIEESTPRELLNDAPAVIEGPPALALADVATYREPVVPPDEPVAARTQPPVQSPVESRAATRIPATPEPGSAERTEAPREARDDPPPPPRPTASSRLVLTVRALQDVQVAVLLDGVGHPRTKSLRAGESKSWKADERFVLEASDGGSLRVFLDGEDRGLAGPAGAPVSRLVIRPGASR
jgi:cytoskeletal protein RodZ